MALLAKEAALRNPQEILAHFSRHVVLPSPAGPPDRLPVLENPDRGRAEEDICRRNGPEARPDDRVVMENLSLRLTS
jgi:hypothetical protein